MISAYIKPPSLNMAMQSTATLGAMLYPDGLDKRSTGFMENLRDAAMVVVDTAQDIADATANLLGKKAPMYMIGEIPEEYLGDTAVESSYIPDNLSGLVRGISSAANGVIQEGVIIDGLGNADGTFSVELTSNPAFYKTSGIVDQRYRNPAKLRMTVMVSDHYTDTGSGTMAQGLSTLDPTGAFGAGIQMLAYEGHTRSQYALMKLRWLMENAMPFTVYTPHGIYENMLIKALNPRTDAEKMEMLYCDIEFQEILFYTPYSNTPGRVPARRGVTQPSPGWTSTAVDKIDNLMASLR